MRDIPLHPKYGLNATVPICIFCGEQKNQIALLGKAYKDEAPSSMVIDSEPCEKCQEKMKQGLTLIEVESKEDLTPRAWAVVKNECMEDFLKHLNWSEEDKDHIRKQKVAFVSLGFLKQVFGSQNEAND